MKNAIIKALLGMVLKSILSGEWIAQIKDAMQKIDSQELPGTDKKALLIKIVESMGWNLASWVLNFAIEAILIIIKIESDNLVITENK